MYSGAVQLTVSVIVPVRNEARNLPRCLESLRGAGEIYVIDSQSEDETVEIACSYGAKVVQIHYRGGWPKKRQWALDTLPLAYDWVLLIDADEVLTPELAEEIKHEIQNSRLHGYYIALRMHSTVWVDRTIATVHEHVMVEGETATLQNPLLHHNIDSLSRYIQKHNEYSNWEASVWLNGKGCGEELPPSLVGSQAQRRRWLRKKFFALPGSPVLFFLYKFVFRLGFLDGVPGLIYCGLQGVQFFHIKAKIYELSIRLD